jgi:Tol biopolymer transport system component
VGLSPSGETVAYFTPEGLVTRDVAGGRETLVLPVGDPAFGLPGTTSALLKADPQWHPSGTHLTYGASVGVDRFRGQSMPPRGGEVVPLLDFVPETGEPAGGHQVFPDGERVLMVRHLEPESAKPWLLIGDRRTDSIVGLDVQDGAVRIWDATISPDDEWIAYIAEREDQSTFLGTVAVDGGGHHILLEAGQELSKWPETSSSPAWPGNRALKWVAPDRLYYRRHTGRGMDIWIQRVDPVSGEAKGSPRMVYPRLPRGAGFDISADARTLAYAGGFNRAQVHLYDLEDDGGRMVVRDSLVTSGTGWNVASRLAPAGRRLAFLAMTLNGADLFVSDTAVGGFRRINVPNGWTTAWALEWAPDGQRVAMSVGTRAGPRLVIVDVDSGRLEVIEGAMAGPPARLLWAGDGECILIPSPDAGYWALFDLETGQERRLFESIGGEIVFVVSSQDGERVLGMDITDGSLWVASLDSGELRRGAALGGGVARQPLWWDPDGTLLVHDVFAGRLWRLDWETGEEELWAELPARCIHEGYTDISPDGRTLACSVRELISDVWIVEDFDPEVVAGAGR